LRFRMESNVDSPVSIWAASKYETRKVLPVGAGRDHGFDGKTSEQDENGVQGLAVKNPERDGSEKCVSRHGARKSFVHDWILMVSRATRHRFSRL
jgi:hypothetical protein